MLADQIPVARTPPGGYGDDMPPPILEGCTEPLAPGAPDLRGTWRVTWVEHVGAAPHPDQVLDHVERIEQCGDRLVVTSTGVIHDMRCDGTVERGVDDVSAVDGRPIRVVATYEDGVHVLRPVGLPGVEVTRHLEGDELVWRFPRFTARLRRVDGVS